MAPSGLAILIGAGPNTGTGIARILSHPSHGNLAVALLARRPEPLQELTNSLRSSTPGAVLEAFPTDTSPDSLKKAFADIKRHPSFSGLKLRLAIYSVKHSSKKPFLEETYEDFTTSLEAYVGGAFTFAQEALARLFADHGDEPLSDSANPGTKGTLIFTGTLGALRCSAQFAAYGAGRASVRQLAQTLAREMSDKGVHVVHTIANGAIVDAQQEQEQQQCRAGKKMSADAVGKTYLWLHQQEPELWTHELDMRPACEKF
ncbi:Short-chain dehydrogenase/reductase SDR [Macrophomina phaseolina MS6]|uniref:Short-chain dehydrogenase/reductase SDR n=1 Tax=Macrophomina phaseolina (strain MS6) TaxID=1126212 RepID=K2S0X1_MACPH|nr:Short-chain dehydrogenase/reductase SDR [Macrophomina phaseolina MS6]